MAVKKCTTCAERRAARAAAHAANSAAGRWSVKLPNGLVAWHSSEAAARAYHARHGGTLVDAEGTPVT